MPLETATYLSQLVSTNPAATDTTGQGDDHLRLIKAALVATFPNFTAAALTSTQAQIQAAVTASSTGPLALSAGTAAAPAYSFSGETNTGLYKSAAGVVSVSILGTLLASFAATGFTLAAGNLAVSAGSVTASGDFNTTAGAFKLNGTNIFPVQSGNIGALQVLTAALADANVTYAKIQNVTTNRLLGNVSGGAAAPEEITIGAGLKVTGTTLSAPANPPRGVFINKKIKVLTNTTVSVSADGVVVSDGTTFTNVVVSNTLTTNLGLGLDQLDSTTVLAAAQWLYLYAIYNGTTVHVVASSSASAPDLSNGAFSGYTSYAPLGAVRTAPASTNLMGTWQLNKRAQYVVGLAQTATSLQMDSGAKGNPVTPTWAAVSVSSFVPATATVILGSLGSSASALAGIAAPNNSYGGVNQSTNCPPVIMNPSNTLYNIPFQFVLESTNIYWATGGSGGHLDVLGWEE